MHFALPQEGDKAALLVRTGVCPQVERCLYQFWWAQPLLLATASLLCPPAPPAQCTVCQPIQQINTGLPTTHASHFQHAQAAKSRKWSIRVPPEIHLHAVSCPHPRLHHDGSPTYSTLLETAACALTFPLLVSDLTLACKTKWRKTPWLEWACSVWSLPYSLGPRGREKVIVFCLWWLEHMEESVLWASHLHNGVLKCACACVHGCGFHQTIIHI